MKKNIIILIPLILFIFSSLSEASLWGESASSSDLTDQRTFSSPLYNPSASKGGLDGYWPYSFKIGWNITYDINQMLWTYEYSLSASRKSISHFILELTSGVTQGDFSSFSINGRSTGFGKGIVEIGAWRKNQGNPGLPNGTDIYGIKFNKGGTTVKYAFTTDLEPVWGNFYVKSGKDKGKQVYAVNQGLEVEGFNSNNKLDFIVRPGTEGGSYTGGNPPMAPEPISSSLFLAGTATLVVKYYVQKRKRKKMHHEI